MPSERDAIQRRVMQLQIERVALEKEKDPASRERLARLEKELADAKAEADRLTAQWQEEKQGVQRLGELREELEQQRLRLEQYRRSGELSKAAELMYGVIPDLERKIK